MTTMQQTPSHSTARAEADLRAAIAEYKAAIVRAELDTVRSELETLAILGGLPNRTTHPKAARAPLTALLRRKDHR